MSNAQSHSQPMFESALLAYRHEMGLMKEAYRTGDIKLATRHVVRAHILGQRRLIPHFATHAWMLRMALRKRDAKDAFGQLIRLAQVVPGWLSGWVPVGNPGLSSVHPWKPVPMSSDLAAYFVGDSIWRHVLRRVLIVGAVAAAVLGALAWQDSRRAAEAASIEREWTSARVERLPALGETTALEILPLVNRHASAADLLTEPGVSYLVKTDSQTILFDVGWNRAQTAPSPLVHNMRKLGVDSRSIDSVFISHAHRDHVGGVEAERAGTFSMSPEGVDLNGKRLLTPVPMTYPGMDVKVLGKPERLFPGVATTGPIARSLFVGRIDEQSLVVNVAGKGLVVIVGCGHQTIPKLLQRVRESFSEPIYAVVGDLHFPVPEGRMRILGIDVQRLLASGDGPFHPISRDQVLAEMGLLDAAEVKLLAVGTHDTSDEMIQAFSARFGERFQRVEVGRPIRLGGARTSADNGNVAALK